MQPNTYGYHPPNLTIKTEHYDKVRGMWGSYALEISH